jgi:copper(I)-binding protein
MRSRFVASRVLAIVAVAAALAGCATGSPSPTSSGPAIEVTAAWARPAAAGADSAAYLTITNHGAADRLTAVRTPVAGSAMIHRTTTDSAGMTGMSMMDGVAVPAGGVVTLEPGGIHLMLTGLTSALESGTSIALELTFEHAGTIRVDAAVRPA